MEKERLEGLDLQVSIVFARLDALKKALPKENLDKYLQAVEQKKQYYRDKYDVNGDQLEEWFQ